MTRIAILGSCITRDLWPIRGGGAEQLLYVCRTSLPTLLSPPLRGLEPASVRPGDLTQHEHGALLADIQKTALARLIAWRPTHVIFDFIDERFDIISAGGALVLNSGEMVRSGYADQPALKVGRTIPRLSAAADRLWLEAAREFATLVRATALGQATLILHSALWADQLRQADGALAPVKDVRIVADQHADIADYNALIARQEAAFEAVMPPMIRIAAPHFHLADPQHRWGLSPFHYIPEYYDEIRAQLTAIDGLENAFREPLAAPSAPAA